ncbi:mitotic interactor and substrate of PLK1 isoform X1 [Dermochelys coriacea]|uniref:mitotic interactor and substrate of PLK1 isoform X1 n=2 Tax=Dermochelys coriacea TaxID=27794 RepID=UPI001CA9C2C1|nr:mitotic interactor and substrate of PLK1 isoform X1 [Dermochelys coriacea]
MRVIRIQLSINPWELQLHWISVVSVQWAQSIPGIKRLTPADPVTLSKQGQQNIFHAEGLQVYEEPAINPTAEQQLRVQEDASEELPEESPQEMDRVTRNLIFHLPHTTPKYNTHQGSLSAELRAESSNDEFAPYSQGKWKAENGHDWRPSYLPEDRSELATNSLDAGRDLWTPPPDRESKLELVTSGMLYDVRAYKEERKPSKLYSDDEEEPNYPLTSLDISPEKAKELEEERKEVIQSQVVRRSSTMAEKWNSIEELDSLNTGSASRSEAKQGGGYATSFALCFYSRSPEQVRTPVDPENIDREQINFAAARQQFLMLEKTNPSSLFSPRQKVMSPKPEPAQNTSEGEWHCAEGVVKMFMGYDNADAPSQREINGYDMAYETPMAEELYAPKKTAIEREDPNGRTASLTKASFRDDVDSGLGEMSNESSVGYISDGSMSNEVFDTQLDLKAGNQDPAKELKARDETPIEREIRLAMEREESLRKERGIQRLSSSNELVEIQTKPLLSTSFSLSSSRKAKDKGHVSFYVQREIEQETKREEDLKKEGRLLGIYDKGTQQELGERKKVFEQEDAFPTPHKPAFAKKSEDLRGTLNSKFPLEQAVDGSFSPTESTTDGKRVRNHNVNLISFQAYQPYSTLNTSKRSTVDELLSCSQPSGSCSKLVDEDSFGARCPNPTEKTDSTASPEERVRVHKEYFATPFWKPKISFVSDQGTQGLFGKEKMLEPVGTQEDQYTLKKCKPQTSWLIEEEIRSNLQREQELQEEWRHRLLRDSFSPASDDSSAREKGFRSQLSSQSSAASGTADSYWVTESPVFAPASHQSGTLGSAPPSNVPSPYQGYTGRHASETAPDGPTGLPWDEKKRKLKEDRKYASIEASDEVNAEILESTRVTRHKNAMAERWESGQFFNKDNA